LLKGALTCSMSKLKKQQRACDQYAPPFPFHAFLRFLFLPKFLPLPCLSSPNLEFPASCFPPDSRPSVFRLQGGRRIGHICLPKCKIYIKGLTLAEAREEVQSRG